jgi:DNA recombination protein RmuC
MDIILAAIILGICIVIAFYLYSRFFSSRIEKNIISRLQDSLSKASMDALDHNSDQFLKLANERFSRQAEVNSRELESKKELIDSTLSQLKGEMEKVQQLMTGIEKDTEGKFTAVTKGIQFQTEETSKLNELINNLSNILSSSESRGKWGEKMAEDILRLVGMEEGVNYIRQSSVGNSRSRPDYTFLLPQSKVVNMDVKFPFDNYRRYCEENNADLREKHKKQFIRDVRNRIKEVTTREYINPEADTLDYVIIFIPLEQAYSFIMENDQTFIDDALSLKVIVCAPWTLYAYLRVIRQAVDNFSLEKSAGKILNLMSDFNRQWHNYREAMKKLGDKIEALQNEYMTLVTTRSNQLEKPLQKVEQLVKQKAMDKNGPDQGQD